VLAGSDGLVLGVALPGGDLLVKLRSCLNAFSCRSFYSPWQRGHSPCRSSGNADYPSTYPKW